MVVKPEKGVNDVTTSTAGEKSLACAYVLAILLGGFGLHHFYLRRYGFGVLYLFTCGLFGVGYIVDLFRLPVLVRDANQQRWEKTLDDAYLLWFVLGLFGGHHFYLKRAGWGVTYILTAGLLGFGWLVDAFRMHILVQRANGCKACLAIQSMDRSPNIVEVYVLGDGTNKVFAQPEVDFPAVESPPSYQEATQQCGPQPKSHESDIPPKV